MEKEMNNAPVSEIEKILEVLTKNYGIDSQVLANSIGLEKDMLDHYAQRKDSIPQQKKQQLVGLLGSISCLPNIGPDDRTRAVLDVLINIHRVPADSIACLARVTLEELIRFIAKEEIPLETKYKIASASMMLHFLFKPAN